MGKCFLPIKLTDKKKDSGLKNSIEIKVPQAKFRRISNPAELPFASVGGIFCRQILVSWCFLGNKNFRG
jgi:hypothetical protein